MIILGIDPGLAIVGWGVLECNGARFRPLGYGSILTPAGMRTEDRLVKIYNDLTTIIDHFHPDEMAVEELFFNNNQKTVINVAQARGVILLTAEENRLPIFEYTPLQVKQAMVGYGRAEKTQVQEMTKMFLHLDKIPKPDDAADALALAICHGHASGSLIMNGRF